MIGNKHKLVYIRWVDCYDFNGGWKALSEASDWYKDDFTIEQVGWIHEENNKFIVLVNMVSDEMDAVNHITKIPKPWIKVREEIKLKKYNQKQ